jgi:hypothetical protein
MSVTFEFRFAEYIRRLMGLRESTALDVLPDLMPVVSVLRDEDPALYRLRNEKLFGAGVEGTSAAAQFPTCWLTNPSPNAIVVCETLTIHSGGAFAVAYQTFGTPPGAGLLGVNGEDDRDVGNLGLQAQVAFESAAAAIGVATPMRVVQLLANTTLVLPVHIVLRPSGVPGAAGGSHLRVQGQNANSQLHVNFYGYERALGQAELR